MSTQAPHRRGRDTRSWFWPAAGCGVLGGLVVHVIALAVSVFFGAATSPFFAVGAWIVDLTPAWFRDAVIAVFGDADKAVLFGCLILLLLALSVAVGILEYLRPPLGSVLLAVIGAVAVVAVLTRANASALSPAPTVIGVAVGVLVLRQAVTRMRRWRPAPASRDTRPRTSSRRPDTTDRAADATGGSAAMARRSFLRFVGGSAIAAVAVDVGVQLLTAGSAAVTSIRTALKLPKPAFPAAPIPASAELSLPGLSPFLTPVDTFYRVDTALQVPAVDPNTWKLRIDGMVEHPLELSFAELMALPLTEHVATLTCVSNEVGGTLAGNAIWLGYPIRQLLARAVPKPGADMVLSTSADGWNAGTPLSVLTDTGTQALLAVGMDGAPLPLVHGFPVRMVVPGLYGYVSATKWVVRLTVTRFSQAAGYWTDKGWSARGPVKLASRIDTPANNATVGAGRVAIAGVAWDQHVGIDAVQVRIDHGAWQPARLATAVSADTWRQWVFDWDAPKGTHTIQVRARNTAGELQTSAVAPPAPNGATGWHTIEVSVS